MTMEPNDAPYRVEPADGRFNVTYGDGLVAVVCADERSAEHYASLLNQAYGRGYKTGFRDARKNG